MQAIGVLVGLATGVLSGFGIGGGSLLILYLTSFGGMAQLQAAGINLLYFIVCAPSALVSHVKNKLVDGKSALVCAAAGVVTGIAASLLALHLDLSLVRRAFGVFLLYIGARELLCKTPPEEKKDKPAAPGSEPDRGSGRPAP